MKPRIYVETSVISYLTARPSRDLTIASRQQSSMQLWDAQNNYELLISDLVLSEALEGDTGAAQMRKNWLDRLSILPLSDQAERIADHLIAVKALPSVAYTDALHIGIAASQNIEIIASWNFRHIASVWARNRIEAALIQLGYPTCKIATPDELVEGENDENH